MGPLSKHLGVDFGIKEDKDGVYIELSMDAYTLDLIQDAEKTVGKVIPIYDTPGKPQEILMKHDGESYKQEAYKQEAYRRIVGSLVCRQESVP